MKYIFVTFYFFGLGSIAIYGLLVFFWRDKALKCAQLWIEPARRRAPNANWRHVERKLVPPRPVGILLSLAALGILYTSLRTALGRSGPDALLSVVPRPASRVDLTMAVAGVCFFAASVYILIDPLGLYCFFTRQKRATYPRIYKRGWPVTAMALAFIAGSCYFLFVVFFQQ
jgi:hypothetical protein